MEIAVGVARRDLPLFFCSCILHTPHASAAACVAQTGPERRRRCRLSSCGALQMGWPMGAETQAEAGAVAAAAAGDGGAGWDPSGELTGGTMAGGCWGNGQAAC